MDVLGLIIAVVVTPASVTDSWRLFLGVLGGSVLTTVRADRGYELASVRHDRIMRLSRWRYSCKDCGQRCDLPGVDLSFVYGMFLGVSRNGEAVLLNVFTDPVYREVQELLSADPRSATVPAHVLRENILQAFGDLVEPDMHGDPYIFYGAPGCPGCESGQLTLAEESDEQWPGKTVPAQRYRWDRLTSDAKMQKIKGFLGDLPRSI